jgi:hypothetical protein
VVRAAQGAQRMGRSNKERIDGSPAAGLMEAAGLALVEAAKADGSWTLLDAVEDLVVPDDLGGRHSTPPRRARDALRGVPAFGQAQHPRVDRAGPTPERGPAGRRDSGARASRNERANQWRRP